MKRRMKSIYTTQPETVLYMGHRYVLAEKEDEEETEAAEGDEAEEEAPAPKKSTGAARVRIDECTGEGVTFIVKALVHSYDGSGIPGLENAAGGVRRRNFSIKRIEKLTSIPKDVLKMIEDDSNGNAVLSRIEKMLSVRPSPPLYYLSATGGWNWNKRNGDKGVAEIQSLLDFLRGRQAILFSYCHNKVNHGDNPTLI